MINYPKEWKLVLEKYSTPLDHTALSISQSIPSVPVPRVSPVVLPVVPLVVSSSAANAPMLPFACTICCDISSSSQKAFDQHCRIKRNLRSCVALRLPNISVCPVCHTRFANLSRLLTHLSGTTVGPTPESHRVRLGFWGVLSFDLLWKPTRLQ